MKIHVRVDFPDPTLDEEQGPVQGYDFEIELVEGLAKDKRDREIGNFLLQVTSILRDVSV